MQIEREMTQILSKAMEKNVDDIHFLPSKKEMVMYFREAGQLKAVTHYHFSLSDRLFSHLKYLAGLEVGEKRRPQSGSCRYQVEEREVEIRLSTITNYLLQESMVIRILYPHENSQASYLNPEDYEEIQSYLSYRSGLILFSGPVASGKTTTIYQALRQRWQNQECQVITMEDPVEIIEDRFLQTKVNNKAGVGYAELIKASLRHHPDILLVGEIRDEETAKMAVRGALTGHLLLSTIHANSCQGVLNRLLELGISKSQLEETLLLVVNQRLIPLEEKNERTVIFEYLDGRLASQYLKGQDISKSYKSLNEKLEEANQNGLINDFTKKHYSLI